MDIAVAPDNVRLRDYIPARHRGNGIQPARIRRRRSCRNARGGERGSEMARTLRILTWACIAALAVLSLTPADEMARTGLDGRIEHFIAYAGTMSVAVLGYGMEKGVRNIAALCVYAGALEMLQHLSPGRHPSVFDFAASAAGAIAGGLVAMMALKWLLTRRGGARPLSGPSD